MKRYPIEEQKLEFKNIISGPATVGRILNYTILAGKGKLRHKNGHRYINLDNNIGYAWTTELMIGLNIVELGNGNGDVFDLVLTNKGRSLFKSLEGFEADFKETHRYTILDNIKNLLEEKTPEALIIFENIFRKSFPFLILKEYLSVYGYYFDRKNFIDEYFERVKNLYDKGTTSYNMGSRTTTGDNRVPSLIQLCYFFNLLVDEDQRLLFNEAQINRAVDLVQDKKYSLYEMIPEAEKEISQMKLIDDIVEKYGIDGNVLVTSLVRNSFLQQMFKQNLTIEFDSKCVICGLKNKELLIGSHIKPSVECNSEEKVDSNNGLLLCSNHDKLFDRYLITFDPFNGQIKLSKILNEDDISLLSLDKDYCLPDKYMVEQRASYLLYHNLNFESLEVDR